MDVNKWVDELHDGVGLVVDVALVPRHQLASCGLARAHWARQPEDLALLLWLWCDVGAAEGGQMSGEKRTRW